MISFQQVPNDLSSELDCQYLRDGRSNVNKFCFPKPAISRRIMCNNIVALVIRQSFIENPKRMIRILAGFN